MVSTKYLCLLVGIKDLYIHIQNVDLLMTPADEVYFLIDLSSSFYLEKNL